jgi:hypothetical protein
MAMLYPLWSNPVSAAEDDVIYYYPLRKMAAESLRSGQLPLHNPREATGVPLMGDPQSAVMYPPTWMFAATNPKLAYSLSVFLAFSLGGAGMWVYLRRLGLVRPAGLFGTVAFMFCGFMLAHRVHLSIINTACFFPWGLWCIEKLRRSKLRAFLWMVPVGYLTVTGGHLPTLIQMAIVWMGYFLLRHRGLIWSAVVLVGTAALVALLTAPQIVLTAELLSQVTRQRIGYATFGENSFFPPAMILALFPMIMGSRSPNFYPQQWWGPWHLCEMLGYVGLITLVLGCAVVWRFYRRGERPDQSEQAAELRGLVRRWTWIGVGALIWMLGYYLPTYRIVHMLPVLSIVRCPARMVLAVDFALATLAAIAVHLLMTSSAVKDRLSPLGRSIRRTATISLPMIMLCVLGLLAVVGALLTQIYPQRIPFFEGGGWQMTRAAIPANPAVWVPLLLMLVTGLVVRWWLVSPRPRSAVLIVLLLFDLFFVTRFLDVPGRGYVPVDPEVSPAGEWLARNAPPRDTYRIWGLGENYHDRPAELLLPKTAQSLGFSTIASYGPFQSPVHSHLLGFRIFGTNRQWERMIRRNRLLSLYSVRYIIASAEKFRKVIESVRISGGPPQAVGPELLTDGWELRRADLSDSVLHLRTPFLWSWSMATQGVDLVTGETYRISLDARGPDGGAGNFLQAEVFQTCPDGSYIQDDDLALTVCSEQIGPEWRTFEWAFQMPETRADNTIFRVFTMSERAIEARNISLRARPQDRPLDPSGKLTPGEKIYKPVAQLPPRRRDDPPVVIYENLLCLDSPPDPSPGTWDNLALERLKWASADHPGTTGAVPDVGIATRIDANYVKKLGLLSCMGVIIYLGIAAGAWAAGRKRHKRT